MYQRPPETLHRIQMKHDDGFSLVELVVAMAIIGGVLLGLVTLQTRAMVTIAQAKERQQATAIANQVLEQLRALPWNSITKGPASYEEEYVSGDKVTIPNEPITGEPIVERSGAIEESDPAYNSPLNGERGTNLTVHTDPAVPGFEFRAYSFVTQPVSADDMYNIIVLVEWEPRGKTDTSKVLAKTTAFNTDSGSGSTRPYASASQDFFIAEGSASAPSFSITGEDVVDEGETREPGPHEILPGSGISQISVTGPSVGISVDSNQSTKVRTSANSGSIAVYDMDRNETITSGDGVRITASDSVSSGDVSSDSRSIPGRGPKLDGPISGDELELIIDPGRRAGDVESNTDVSCDTWAIAEHPCGSAQARNEKQAVTLKIPGRAPIQLMELSSTEPSVRAARYPGSTVPPTGSKYCNNLAGSGCVDVVANLGSYEADFQDAAKFSSHQLISSAGRGFYETLRAGNIDSARERNVEFSWGETVSLEPSEPQDYRPDEPLEPIFESEDTAVKAEPRISFQPVSEHSENSGSDCQSEACIGRAAVSAVSVYIRYTVTHRGETSSFSLNASLGDTRASATYKAAPEAWDDEG